MCHCKRRKKKIHDSNRCNKMKRMLALEYHHNNTCASTQSNLSNWYKGWEHEYASLSENKCCMSVLWVFLPVGVLQGELCRLSADHSNEPQISGTMSADITATTSAVYATLHLNSSSPISLHIPSISHTSPTHTLMYWCLLFALCRPSAVKQTKSCVKTANCQASA